LLFGPPGTSKTSIAKVIAERLGWPLIVITPSEFLSKGLEQIYVRVHEVFEDLMDISASVVLFDEMDALAQTRGKTENEELDVTRQLLTTSMLPKLANLWNRGRVVFLMATNHRQQLDAAITRPGRFDLLICVGPPPWANKLDGLPVVMKGRLTKDVAAVQQALRSLAKSQDTQHQLDKFTVAELHSFLEHLKRKKGAPDLLTALKEMKQEDFESIVKRWAETTIALSAGGDLEKEYNDDRQACRRQ
jgi:SpoVK/Ycf46/Vps4 family AAA+-type ATPase